MYSNLVHARIGRISAGSDLDLSPFSICGYLLSATAPRNDEATHWYALIYQSLELAVDSLGIDTSFALDEWRS